MLMFMLVMACNVEPGACDDMCAVAAERRGACLEREGLDWEAAGYADAADFEAACLTWAWEQRLLAREAAGVAAARSVEETCLMRQRAYEEDTCDELATIDWSAPAWTEDP